MRRRARISQAYVNHRGFPALVAYYEGVSLSASAPRRDFAPPGPRWRDSIVMLALVVVGTSLCLVRVPLAHHDIVWAEDANIFLYENLNLGPWASLFHGYAGYQHLVPRIGSAFVIGFADLAQYATATFWACSILTGLIGAAVYWLSRDVLVWIPARITAAMITFLLPLATQEVIGNWADIHTYFMWLTPWLYFYRPRSWRAGAGWAVVAFLAIMTEVQAVLFLALIPFFLRRRDRYSRPIHVAFLIGAVWQFATVLTVHRDSSAAWLGIPSLWQGWLINTAMPMVVADPMKVRTVLQTTGFLIPLVVAACFVVAFAVALVWGTPRQRLLAVTFVLASGAIYAAGATVDGSWWFRYAEADAAVWERIINVRYGVAAGMMLAGVVPVAAAALAHAKFPRRWISVLRWWAAWAAMVGMLAVFMVASTQAISTRSWVSGQWSPAVATARVACAGLPLEDTRDLPVAPERTVALTCEQLLR